MAHEIENMMYVGERPWHGLGKELPEAPNTADAIRLAGLDWTVRTEPLFLADGRKASHLATVRESDNAILGVVGPAYHPLQNVEAFSFFDPFVESGAAKLETAGSLRNGKRVWVLAKVGHDVAVSGDDTVRRYLLLSNAHDGTLAARVGFTPTRVVCANTLAVAHDSKASQLLRIMHTKNIVENLEAVQEIVNLANATFEASLEQYKFLASREVNQKDLERYVRNVFGTKTSRTRSRDEEGKVVVQELDELRGEKILPIVTSLFESGLGQDLPGARGTWWGAYNAATEYITHQRGPDRERRLENAWYGQGAALNRRALDLATQLATGPASA